MTLRKASLARALLQIECLFLIAIFISSLSLQNLVAQLTYKGVAKPARQMQAQAANIQKQSRKQKSKAKGKRKMAREKAKAKARVEAKAALLKGQLQQPLSFQGLRFILTVARRLLSYLLIFG